MHLEAAATLALALVSMLSFVCLALHVHGRSELIAIVAMSVIHPARSMARSANVELHMFHTKFNGNSFDRFQTLTANLPSFAPGLESILDTILEDTNDSAYLDLSNVS